MTIAYHKRRAARRRAEALVGNHEMAKFPLCDDKYSVLVGLPRIVAEEDRAQVIQELRELVQEISVTLEDCRPLIPSK